MSLRKRRASPTNPTITRLHVGQFTYAYTTRGWVPWYMTDRITGRRYIINTIKGAELVTTPGPHCWIKFDYKDGWVGVRVEPEDQERANAIKDLIPQDERMYLSNKRTWAFKPQWCAGVVAILRQYCPDFPLILEEKHEDLLRTLLFGPAVVNPTVAPPTKRPDGVLVGTLENPR